MKRALVLVALLFACATVSPQKALLASTQTLAALEQGMAIYCERPDRDAEVCEQARKVDNMAFAAVVAAHATVAAGGDPSDQIRAAELAVQSLASLLQGVR